MSLEEIHRGEEAERLMNNPMIKDALEGIRSGILTAMQNSAMGDESTHNKLVITLQILGHFEKHFKTHMETGKLAKMQYDKDNIITKLKRAARP